MAKVGLTVVGFSFINTVCFQSAATAVTFFFNFDKTSRLDSPTGADATTPPFVGRGTFSFDGEVENGTFSLSSLLNYNFNFEFDKGSTFKNSDIITPINEVLIIITSIPSGHQVKFSNTVLSNSSGGPGSINFLNSSGGYLSFEPPGIGNLDLYFITAPGREGEYTGNYEGTVKTIETIPEPTSNLGLLSLSILGTGTLVKRKLQQKHEFKGKI